MYRQADDDVTAHGDFQHPPAATSRSLTAQSSAAAVFRHLPAWQANYNGIAPHSALGYRAPHEYRAARAAGVGSGQAECLTNRGAEQRCPASEWSAQ